MCVLHENVGQGVISMMNNMCYEDKMKGLHLYWEYLVPLVFVNNDLVYKDIWPP